MIKYFCDRCGKETKKNAIVVQKDVARGGKFNSVIFVFDTGILCEECAEKFDAIKDKLRYEEDIFNMTEEEIRLLRCSFKVGDEVITDDGRVGIIESICTCDKCKARGFYEPRIKMKIGSQIYITDTDKSDGFKAYYKIGNKVFGNIDDQYLLDHLKTYKDAIKEIEAQLDVIKGVRENNNDRR